MNFHYLLMSGHAIYLKQLMAQLNHTGLTPGQPKVLDYLMAHDGWRPAFFLYLSD